MCSTSHSSLFKWAEILEVRSQLTRNPPPKRGGGRSAFINHRAFLQAQGRGPGPPQQLVGRWWFSWRFLPAHEELVGLGWVEGKEQGPGTEAGKRDGGGPCRKAKAGRWSEAGYCPPRGTAGAHPASQSQTSQHRVQAAPK